MKVSFYELLGMIKEGKQPKKVVYKDVIYNWNLGNYISLSLPLSIDKNCLVSNIRCNDMLKVNITILEPCEQEESKKIEKLANDVAPDYWNEELCNMFNKVNELVEAVNELKGKK